MSDDSPSAGQVEGGMRLSRPLRLALIATLAAAVVVSMLDSDDDPRPEPSAKPVRPAAARPSAAPQPAAWPLPLRPNTSAAWEPPPAQALAAWTVFRPPPPPRPEPAASAPPAAPPFPYVLIGRIEDGGVTRALMSGPHRTLDAKAGDVIDGQWRVEDVRGDGLDLLWLPGGLRQTLSYRPT